MNRSLHRHDGSILHTVDMSGPWNRHFEGKNILPACCWRRKHFFRIFVAKNEYVPKWHIKCNCIAKFNREIEPQKSTFSRADPRMYVEYESKRRAGGVESWNRNISVSLKTGKKLPPLFIVKVWISRQFLILQISVGCEKIGQTSSSYIL